MDKEKDIKKIVAVVIVLLIALVAFVLVRGCTKEEEKQPTPSPVPTDIVEPTPAPDEEKDDKQTNNTTTTEPTVDRVVDKVEVKPTPIVYASKQQLDELMFLVENARYMTSDLTGSSDDRLAELVNELNKLCKKAEDLVEKGNASKKEIDALYEEIDNAYIYLADYAAGLYYQVLDVLEELEDDLTKENIEKLRELVKKLPQNEEKDKLVNVVHVLEFEEQLMDTTVTEINLKYDLKLYDAIWLDVEQLGRDIVIDGKGHTLTTDSDSTTIGINIEASQVNGATLASHNITIKNVIIDMAQQEADAGVLLLAEEGMGSAPVYGISVLNTDNVTIENVTVKNAEVGIVLDSSKVTLSGEINVTDNIYAGIEVFGTSEKPSTLTIADGATLVNETETHDCPTILVGLADGTVVNNSSVVLHTSNEESSVNYYLVEENKEIPTVTE